MSAPITWRPSGLAYAVALCAGAALVVGLVTGRWTLIVFAAPLLGVLASVAITPRAHSVTGTAEPDLVRCFESETVTFTFAIDLVGAGEVVSVVPEPTPGLTSSDGSVHVERWGRYRIPLRVTVRGAGGLLTGAATPKLGNLHAYPVADPLPTPLPRTALPNRIGTHLTKVPGPGVEYADLREYVPGDQLRAINWAVSARRGRLHVTRRLTDRAADVVVVVDMYAQPEGPATVAFERSARGATQVVQTALQAGDRAGIVALGRSPRWLGPDIGRRQFYRVLDTLLEVGDEFDLTSGTLVPRAALPRGAIVIAFSTMLDTEFALSLIELRRRGHTVVAVDVLGRVPFAHEMPQRIERMWRLGRSAMYRDMAVVGVTITEWRDDITLDLALHLVREQARR